MEGLIQIREMASSDVQAVLAIQAASLDAATWDRRAYEQMLAGATSNRCIVALFEDGVAGFASFRVIDYEAELLNLAVRPERRRRGLGTELLRAVTHEVTRMGATRLFLEVRESNTAAINLYRRFGFEQQYRRAGYYRNPPEDALAMARQLA